jgi:hypothetical protein
MPWLVVVGSSSGLELALTGVLGFRARVATSAIRAGDQFALYVTRSAFHNPTRDFTQIAATGIVTGGVCVNEVRAGEETFPQSCSVEIQHALPARNGLPFVPLVPQMAFIRDKIHWSSYVRTSLRPLPQTDFNVIEAALRAAVDRLRLTS